MDEIMGIYQRSCKHGGTYSYQRHWSETDGAYGAYELDLPPELVSKIGQAEWNRLLEEIGIYLADGFDGENMGHEMFELNCRDLDEMIQDIIDRQDAIKNIDTTLYRITNGRHQHQVLREHGRDGTLSRHVL